MGTRQASRPPPEIKPKCVLHLAPIRLASIMPLLVVQRPSLRPLKVNLNKQKQQRVAHKELPFEKTIDKATEQAAKTDGVILESRPSDILTGGSLDCTLL